MAVTYSIVYMYMYMYTYLNVILGTNAGARQTKK